MNRSTGLGGAGFDAFGFGAGAAKVVKRNRFFHPAVIEVVADFLAFETDKIQAVDALVDLLAVEHAAAQLVDANAEQFFVVLLYLAPAGFITW